MVLAGAALADPVQVWGTGGRMALGGYLDGLAIVDTGGGPRQLPQALADTWVDTVAADWLRGHVELRSQVGGPFVDGTAGVFNFVHAFQNRSPSLDFSEAYADVRLSRADLRIGVQKIAWGKLDGVPPTDVINPRDFHDPFIEDFEEAKIGIPAVQATYYLPDAPSFDLDQLRATLVYVPIAVPSRLPLVEERWFPASLNRSQVSVEFCEQTFVIPVVLQTLNHRPPKGLDAGGIAFRLSGTWRESDWDIYHYTGPETGPNAELLAEVVLDGPLDPAVCQMPGGEVPIKAIASLRQKHDVTHMTGGDWAATFGGATVRAEAAVFNNRPYLRLASDLVEASLHNLTSDQKKKILAEVTMNGRAPVQLGDLFPLRDSIEWGIGVDYLVHGFVPIVQLNQIILLEPAPPLLINQPETRLTAVVRRSFLQDRLELEFRGVYELERGGWFVFPRVSYLIRDDLRVRLGYLALGGTRNSLFGQFGNNDELVLQTRYSF